MTRIPRIAIIAPGDPPDSFPDPGQSDPTGEGLIALGGDLSEARLLAAYRRGIFPWYEEDQPILWWNPDPRAILPVDGLHIARRLARTIRTSGLTWSASTDCEAVIRACRAVREPGGTWITTGMEEAYIALHARGYVHSLEIWDDDELAGGIYGVLIGRMFFGESMFSARRDASKMGLVALCHHLGRLGGRIVDCQVPSHHLSSMGMKLVPRQSFLNALGDYVNAPPVASQWIAARRPIAELAPVRPG